MIQLWTTIFYEPLYNLLVFLVQVSPFASLGIAVILLTVIVRLILSPLSYRAVLNQITQQKINPLLQEIKEKYKDDPKEQFKKIQELFKEHKTNPFAGCFLILLQFPVIIAVYQVFLKGISEAGVTLYSFVTFPQSYQSVFLWTNLGEQSIIFALIAGLTQYIQLYLSPTMRNQQTTAVTQKQGNTPDFAVLMQKNMKVFLPVMIAVFAYLVPAAVALYWIVNNLFTIAQEVIIQKKIEKREKTV